MPPPLLSFLPMAVPGLRLGLFSDPQPVACSSFRTSPGCRECVGPVLWEMAEEEVEGVREGMEDLRRPRDAMR